MIGMSTRRALDTPGLVNCGIGGRRRRATRAVAVTAQRVAWHHWMGGLAASIFTKITVTEVTEVIAHWPK